MTKKIFLLLFLCILFANQAWAQSGTYTANGVTWKYEINGTEATITGETQGPVTFTNALNIPTTIEHGGVHYPVKKIGANAFYNYRKAISITIPTSITTIEKRAFAECRKAVGNFNSSPSWLKIGEEAFYRCEKMDGNLIIPSTITEIPKLAFYQTAITGLTLPEGLLKVGEHAFAACKSIQGTLAIPASVTDIGNGAFSGLMQIKKIEFTSSSNLQNLGLGAFAYCSELEQISELPPNITSISIDLFRDCFKLKGDITIPASVKSLGTLAFGRCYKLNTIKFAAGSQLTACGIRVFEGCSNLKYIDMHEVPNTLRCQGVPITIDRNSGHPFNLQSYVMVYLPAGIGTPAANQFNFVIGNVCQELRIYHTYAYYTQGQVSGFYGCDVPIQYPFVANKALYIGDVRYGIDYIYEFRGSNCKTIYLPYPATLPDGMSAYELTSKRNGGRKTFRFTSITGNQLEANKPYLIRIVDGSASKQLGTDVNVQVPVTPPSSATEVQATDGSGFYFGGTVENISNATAAGMHLYNLQDNEWRPIRTDNTYGFVHSFRCYIRSTTPIPAGTKGFAIVLDDENSTTGIDTAVENEVEQDDSPIYTLDGKLMGTDIDALPSGEIYVKNGKKFYKF